MIEEQDLEQEYAIGEEWLEQFVDDIDALYEYPDRDLDDKQRQVENLMGIPKTMWRRSGGPSELCTASQVDDKTHSATIYDPSPQHVSRSEGASILPVAFNSTL